MSFKILKTSCQQPSKSLKHQRGYFRSAAFLCIPHSALQNDEECCIPQDAPSAFLGFPKSCGNKAAANLRHYLLVFFPPASVITTNQRKAKNTINMTALPRFKFADFDFSLFQIIVCLRFHGGTRTWLMCGVLSGRGRNQGFARSKEALKENVIKSFNLNRIRMLFCNISRCIKLFFIIWRRINSISWFDDWTIFLREKNEQPGIKCSTPIRKYIFFSRNLQFCILTSVGRRPQISSNPAQKSSELRAATSFVRRTADSTPNITGLWFLIWL